MSFWQFMACVDGYIAANSVEQPPPAMSDDEFDALVEKYGD